MTTTVRNWRTGSCRSVLPDGYQGQARTDALTPHLVWARCSGRRALGLPSTCTYHSWGKAWHRHSWYERSGSVSASTAPQRCVT